MLTRKPRVGEVVIAGDGTSYRVRRFGEGFHESICYIGPADRDLGPREEANSFIWTFSPEGLNTYFTIEV